VTKRVQGLGIDTMNVHDSRDRLNDGNHRRVVVGGSTADSGPDDHNHGFGFTCRAQFESAGKDGLDVEP
jgi:hypothetical protein